MRTISIRHLALAIGPLLAIGCGGGEPASGNPGTAGSTSSGGAGTTSTSGGAGDTGGPGTAGVTGGSGVTGTTGTGGTGMVGSCAQPTAASPLISDFSGTATTPVSMQANGGTDVWTVSPAGMGSAVVMAGEMHATTTAGDWASMSTVIGGRAPCLDMSKYTGVKFKIKSATNTSLIFEIATVETKTDFSHMRKTITVGPAYAEVSVPFAMLERAPFGAGMTLPVDYKPEQHMFAVAFGVGSMKELLDVYLDDVTFY